MPPLEVAQQRDRVGLLPVALELGEDHVHLLVGEDRGADAGGEGAHVLARQALRLVGEPQRLPEARAVADHAVVAEQAAAARPQRLQHAVGQLLGAERGVPGALDLLAAGSRHHVVERWDVPPLTRERRAIGRVCVDHRLRLGHALVDVEMHAPFARRQKAPVVARLEAHEHDVFRGHLVVRDARGRHEEAPGHAAARIARGALVDAHGVHL
mmetsp:Transcript_43197/g.115781  ORF Transcript_43197/g.115781 Transcript_43197/m.115781 type:complete len:212 (-) Transcript_43197:37-672(-)